MNDLKYEIGYRAITASQYYKFLTIKELRIDKDKFSVIGKLLVNESNETKDICIRRGIEKLKEIKTQIEAIITEIEAGGGYAR